MSARKTPVGFDGAQLQTMGEPLAVRVERIRGAGRPPEVVPLSETTMVKAQVPELEQAVLGLVGGGEYTAYLTDPDGKTLKWTFAWDANVYPPKVADMLAEAAGGMAQPLPGPQAPWTSQAPRAPYGGAYAAPQVGWPGHGQPPMPMPMQPPMQVYGQMPWWMFSGMQSQMPARDALQEKFDEERRARIDAENRGERERMDQAHRAEIAELRRAIEDTKRSPGADAAVEELKRQNADLLRRLDDQTAKAEAVALRAEVAARMDRLEQLITQAQGQAQAQNPMVEVMKEQARAQADAARAHAEATKGVAERLIPMIMTPAQYAEVMRTAKDDSSSAAVVAQMAQSVGGVLKLQQEASEAIIAQLSQGAGSPAIGLVAQGLQGAQSVLERYLTGKETAKIAAARAAVQESTARIVEARERSGELGGAPQAAQLPPASSPPAGKTEPRPGNGTQPNPAQAQFGPALNAVMLLRANAPGMTPEQVVEAVVGALQQYEAQKDRVPAFKLLAEGKIVEFFALLIPTAPQEFIDACTKLLLEAAQGEEEAEEEPTREGDAS